MTKWPCPGEEKWQDPSLATQRQHFSLCVPASVLFAQEHSSKRGLLSRRPPQAAWPLRTHHMLSPVIAQVRGEVTTRANGEAPPGVRVCPGDLALPSRGRARRLQPSQPSQAPFCCTVPIFLVSINSGKIFKYTKA